MRTSFPLFVVAAFLVGCLGEAAAQPLGTFRWQLSPYRNVLTLLPTANGPVYASRASTISAVAHAPP